MKSYDFSVIPDYLNRQMFLDKAGGVTVQRFEEVAYPRLAKYEEIARGFFWIPEEVSLAQDKIDHRKASEAAKFAFTQNLLRQTALDSLQGRAPSQVFTPVASVPELEALVNNWSFFETNIHSKSYSHIIRNIYNMPQEEFNSIHDCQPIIDMAASVGRYYEELHILNCRKELANAEMGYTVVAPTEKEHINAIWMALNASYALEALRFMVSFATSLAMVENRIYMGNGNIISLILQDELLHAEWTAYIINQVVKDDPRFAKAKVECEAKVWTLYDEVIKEEKAWADHLFQHGVVVGLNAEILKTFVDYRATQALKDIGIKVPEEMRNNHNPIPWFNKHTRQSAKQTALQEQESINYIIGAMGGDVDHDELPDL
jgi:ribonucleoside-diphosphate reductase beta chain